LKKDLALQELQCIENKRKIEVAIEVEKYIFYYISPLIY